jgi:hypothetical protein
MEVRGYTRADSADIKADGILLLAGIPPVWKKPAGPAKSDVPTHEDRNRRIAAMSRQAGRLLEQDPSLLVRARNHLRRLLKKGQGPANRDLQEWDSILENYSIPRIASFLRSSSERAVRLRQSCPFFAVLTPREKERVQAAAKEGT